MPTNQNSRIGRLFGLLKSLSYLIGVVIAFGAIAAMLSFIAGVFHEKVPEHPTTGHRRTVSSDQLRGRVRQVKIPRYETAVGTIKPVHESSLSSKLLARVAEINVKAGQSVTQHQVLVRLDDADLKARLEQALAVESAAIARQGQADADYSRAQKLLQGNAIAKAEYDQALQAKQSAASDVTRAQQAIKEAQVVLEYATIRAPFGGTVVDKKVESGDTVAPGQVLLTIYDPAKMQMVATVRESLATQLKVGQTLPAQLESLGYNCEATISEIVPQADVSSRSFAVKVTGPCPPGVYSGMFGRLMIPQAEEEILVVPAAAIRRVGQLTLVDVVTEQSANRRAVQLGRTFNDAIEVLSGLQADEEVLLSQEATQGQAHE